MTLNINKDKSFHKNVTINKIKQTKTMYILYTGSDYIPIR